MVRHAGQPAEGSLDDWLFASASAELCTDLSPLQWTTVMELSSMVLDGLSGPGAAPLWRGFGKRPHTTSMYEDRDVGAFRC
jgi:hypothetical protein